MAPSNYEQWRYKGKVLPIREPDISMFEDGRIGYANQGDWYKYGSPPLADTINEHITAVQNEDIGLRREYGSDESWRDLYVRAENAPRPSIKYPIRIPETSYRTQEYRDRYPRVNTAIEPAKYRQQVFDEYGVAPQAQRYLSNVPLEIRDPYAPKNTGGGGYYNWDDSVTVFEPNDEATIHEYAHAWWEPRRWRDKTKFVDTMLGITDIPAYEQMYPEASELMHAYKYGDNNGWSGMYETEPGSGEWNDHEMFAGLASGVMGDRTKIPPELKPYYAQLYDKPITNYPSDTPAPYPTIEPNMRPPVSTSLYRNVQNVPPPMDEINYWRGRTG